MIAPSAAPAAPADDDLFDALDCLHVEVGRAQRTMLSLIARADQRRDWQDTGARDLAHRLSMRYGISQWKARRWIVAAHALERLPALADALGSGRLSLDKVAELARFAEPETERELIRWSGRVSVAAVRRRGDVWARTEREDLVETEKARTLSWWWWFDEDRRLGLEAELPAAQGAIVVRAIERIAARVPEMPGEEGEWFVESRRADALVALCSGANASEPDPDRATVVVHAQLDGLRNGSGGCELEDGPSLHPDTVHRLLCNGRVQTVIEDPSANVVALGRISREPPAWMLRQLRYRDRECRFPGCGSRRFTEAHHVRWWRQGGPTELDNLVLICSFHHRLVHEHGWSLKRCKDGEVRWFDESGTRYRAGPPPPDPRAIQEHFAQVRARLARPRAPAHPHRNE